MFDALVSQHTSQVSDLAMVVLVPDFEGKFDEYVSLDWMEFRGREILGEPVLNEEEFPGLGGYTLYIIDS
tara:strand:- start:11 stop:220 length:210 start_codon:yes stop_codon:yes gene_type:complete